MKIYNKPLIRVFRRVIIVVVVVFIIAVAVKVIAHALMTSSLDVIRSTGNLLDFIRQSWNPLVELSGVIGALVGIISYFDGRRQNPKITGIYEKTTAIYEWIIGAWRAEDESRKPQGVQLVQACLVYYQLTPSSDGKVDADEVQQKLANELRERHEQIRKQLEAVAPASVFDWQSRDARTGSAILEYDSDVTRDIAAQFAICAAKIMDQFRPSKPGKHLWDVRFVVGRAKLTKLIVSIRDPATNDEAHKEKKIESKTQNRRSQSFIYYGDDDDRAKKWLFGISDGEVVALNVTPEDADFLREGSNGAGILFHKIDLGGDKDVFDLRYQRPWKPAPDEVVSVSQKTYDEHLDSPLKAGSRIAELKRYQLPNNFFEIRQTLLDNHIILLKGKPGIGKSLCALRLAAELLQEDRQARIHIPRIAEGAWRNVYKRPPQKEIIILDDAFGKVAPYPSALLGLTGAQRQTDTSEHEIAQECLHNELPEPVIALARYLGISLMGGMDTVDGKGEVGKSLGGQPKTVIMTVRADIWLQVKERWDELEIGKMVLANLPNADLTEGSYNADALRELFDELCTESLGKQLTMNFRAALRTDVARLQTPMNVEDFVDRLPTALRDPDTYDDLGGVLEGFSGDPKQRYARELQASLAETEEGTGLSQFCYFFFLQTLGDPFLEESQLASLFSELSVAAGLRLAQADQDQIDVWEDHKTANKRWGRWSGLGHFLVAHPLREEALVAFFAEKGADAAQKIFEAFLKLAGRQSGPNAIAQPDLMNAAAATVARIGGKIGGPRKKLVSLLLRIPEEVNTLESSKIILANSIGNALSAPQDLPAGQLVSDDLRAYWMDVLDQLLDDSNDRVFAATAAAVCDTIGARSVELHKRQSLDGGARQTLEVLAAKVCKRGPVAEVGANEQIAWAIVSNFSKLPESMTELLFEFAGKDKNNWVILRSLEAMADYYDELKQTNSASRIRACLKKGAVGDISEDPVVARGMAGAIEENYESLDTKKSRDNLLFSMLEAAGKRGSELGVLEWVIWAAGECIENLMREDKDRTRSLLGHLARHEDVRVRVWVARALAEQAEYLDRELITRGELSLCDILSRLADDPNEHVWTAASKVFSCEADNESHNHLHADGLG
jgi:DNA polymerase III delta prime subunit